MAAIIVTAAAALVASGPANARRPATSSERALISAAVKQKEKQDPSSGVSSRWAVLHRCNAEVVYVSTVDARWAAFWFKSKYSDSDPRLEQCRRDDLTIDGVWVVRRIASRRWVGTGWISGDYHGFCEELRATRIPLAAFNDVFGRGFWSKCPP